MPRVADTTMEDVEIDTLTNFITEDLQRMKGQASSIVSIPRVPERIRQGKNDAYEPRIISFGPYHHGETRLQAMEKYKLRFLEAILSRNPQIPLKCYCRKMKEQEAETRRCYSDNFKIDNSKDFVKMTLLDGCFIVEYLLRIYERFYLRTRINVENELDSMIWRHD